MVLLFCSDMDFSFRILCFFVSRSLSRPRNRSPLPGITWPVPGIARRSQKSVGRLQESLAVFRIFIAASRNRLPLSGSTCRFQKSFAGLRDRFSLSGIAFVGALYGKGRTNAYVAST